MKHYNYIFTGSGLSALMTVYKMILSEKFKDKSILLLDEDSKKTNDRTWCFWSKKPTIWDQVISQKWDSALFANKDFKRDLELKPYHYNQIRGVDFYNFVFELISKESNITFLNEKVTDIIELKTHVFVATADNTFSCDYLFNSIFTKSILDKQTKFPVLQQHFIGWFIKSTEEIFTTHTATFMDFSVDQRRNTRFMYVLPTSKTEALVEYTLFSETLLPKEEYENEIVNYLKNLGATTYTIQEKEQGSIPMTCFPFWKKNTNRVLNIGTAGGWTKASTGYTFKKSEKKSTALVIFLQNSTATKLSMKDFHTKTRFWFYDLLLLDVLYRHNEIGSNIFSSLFKKGKPSLIFKFLDEETSLIEELKVILKCPKKSFVKALFNVIFK